MDSFIMDDIGSAQSDCYVGSAKYRFNVPALSLSDYQSGSVIVMRYLYRSGRSRNMTFALLSGILTAATFSIIPLILNACGIGLYASIWQGDDGWLISFYTVEVLVILLFCVVFGIFVFGRSLNRNVKKMREKLYMNSSLMKSGYTLILGEMGVSCLSQMTMTAVKWPEIKGIKRSNGMIYFIFCSGGFLWLPENMADCDADSVCDFINGKITAP